MYYFLLLVTVQSIHGFGFNQMPFTMEFELPAFPMMHAMPFPPIFNPAEAVQQDTIEPETRAMDADVDAGNYSTKNKTEVTKDGFKVTTITRNGPGFHSYIKEYEKEGNSTGNGTMPAGLDMGKFMSGTSLFNIMKQLRNMQKKKEKKCKNCGKGKFCDPLFQLCRKKFSAGRTCMFQKQCGKSLKCQWGKCQKAKSGDPGTFCKKNRQCTGDACCRNTPGSFHLMCIPRQAEGAICGMKREHFVSALYVVKRSLAPTCSPCQPTLKCGDSGDEKFKRCVKTEFVEQAADDFEDDNPSNAIDDDNEPEPRIDDKETPGGEQGDEDKSEDGPLKGPPKPHKIGPHIPSKGKEDDDSGESSGGDDGDDDGDDGVNDGDDGDDPEDGIEEDEIRQGTGEGIPIKPKPKKKGGKQKGEKED